VFGEIVNTRMITPMLVAIAMMIMALTTSMIDIEEVDEIGGTGYGHPNDADETAQFSGITTWQDDAWDTSWTCTGGLALVTEVDWNSFVTSGESDPHDYTSWGIGLDHAGAYDIVTAPDGDWVVTAGLECTDDGGVYRSAGGQYGDSHESPIIITITNGGPTIGYIDFTLIEFAEYGYAPTFVCDVDIGIPFELVNDGNEDCADGSDEPQYDASGNEINWFDCHDGTVQITMSVVNDGFDDCYDGEDEIDWFECDSGSQVIPLYYVNDGVDNCADESDEDDGTETMLFECDDATTIPFSYVNDGYEDCSDGEDEAAPSYGGGGPGGDGPTFECDSGGEVIPLSGVNDGYEDCSDGSDEDDGTETMLFECDDATTIPFSHVNDGYDDCSDGEDEAAGGWDPDCEDVVEIIFTEVDYDSGTIEFISTCTFSQEDSDAYRVMIDDTVGDGDGAVSSQELDDWNVMMDTCWDDEGNEVDCGDDSECPFDSDANGSPCALEDADGACDWSDPSEGCLYLAANYCAENWDEFTEEGDYGCAGDGEFRFDGVPFDNPFTDGEMGDEASMDGVLGSGLISFDLSETVAFDYTHSDTHTMTYVGSDYDNGEDGCVILTISSTSPWETSTVTFNPASEWETVENANGTWTVTATTDSEGECISSEPGDVEIVWTHPSFDSEPLCDLEWTMANDTGWESGTEIVTGPDGDGEVTLEAGSYMIAVECVDAQGDDITTAWSSADGATLSSSETGSGTVFGWVAFTIPDCLNGSLTVVYSWSSTSFGGNGTVTFHFVGDCPDDVVGVIEGTGGGIPGFTSILTATSLLGAVLYRGRRYAGHALPR